MNIWQTKLVFKNFFPEHGSHTCLPPESLTTKLLCICSSTSSCFSNPNPNPIRVCLDSNVKPFAFYHFAILIRVTVQGFGSSRPPPTTATRHIIWTLESSLNSWRRCSGDLSFYTVYWKCGKKWRSPSSNMLLSMYQLSLHKTLKDTMTWKNGNLQGQIWTNQI